MDTSPTNRRVVDREASEDIGRNASSNATIGDVIAARYNRRDILRGALGVAAITASVSPLALMAAGQAHAAGSRFAFDEVEAGVDEHHHVAAGYEADILIRWGDPVLPDAPAFDPLDQTAEAQAGQFGYNNDFIGIIPIPGEDPNRRALLVVNHEYTIDELMFPGRGKDAGPLPRELVDIEIAAHGGTVIEIEKVDGKWRTVPGSAYNRRLTGSTEMEITGPAAGSDRLKTAADPTGRKVLGMLNNCAGGVTPWGTWITAEENFHGYFWTDQVDNEGKVLAGVGGPEAVNFKRYGVPGRWYEWGQHHDRFNVDKEQNEANRFGWIVEIDPLDPASTPRKRTALGRFKHEGCENIINKDGRLVIYMGDDERFDYVYRFISTGTVNLEDRAANADLLDDGTLSVARYDADGSVHWLPLVYGHGPLTEANGFASQADVLIETRRAADLLGATKMDRPEDVEPNPVTGKVFVILTNNSRRKEDQVDAANPRAENRFGHIIEMTPPDGDHAADTFAWDILLKCGDPSIAEVGATFSATTTESGWFGMPDNCAVDGEGRLWIATDGNSPKVTGRTDGVWALETEGEARGTSKLFFRCPAGAELCGPRFTEDDSTLFVAVQHPGEDGESWDKFGRPSTFADPMTRWPDFQDGMPPRPAVLAITRQGGGRIG